jgi:hypothetical protein
MAVFVWGRRLVLCVQDTIGAFNLLNKQFVRVWDPEVKQFALVRKLRFGAEA